VPPLSEQRAIAQALSDVDNLITALDLLIAKKRDIKQATMQQLLTGKTRLPGFSSAWKKERLGDLIIKLRKTTRPSSAGRESGSFPFFTNTTKPVERYLDEADFDTEAIIANTGGEAYFNYYNGRFAAMSDCMVLEARINTKYLYYFLKLREQSINCNGFTGSGIKHLDKKYFRNIELGYPTEVDEQHAITSVLTDMDAELSALEARRDKTRALKQGMMQELLTGKTRLL
jgi:type I restriction enzyme S subunit